MSSELPSGYVFVDTLEQIDIDAVHVFLTASYWALGRTRVQVERSLQRSVCVAVNHNGALAAFARSVTDGIAVAHINDVFVLPAHRRRGLSRMLVQHLIARPELADVKKVTLNTRDAHGVYTALGFTAPVHPQTAMELRRP
jgi:predicted GNAT family acetyltransferase